MEAAPASTAAPPAAIGRGGSCVGAQDQPPEGPASVAAELGGRLERREVRLGYEHMSAAEALRAVLPPGVEPPVAFETIGAWVQARGAAWQAAGWGRGVVGEVCRRPGSWRIMRRERSSGRMRAANCSPTISQGVGWGRGIVRTHCHVRATPSLEQPPAHRRHPTTRPHARSLVVAHAPLLCE